MFLTVVSLRESGSGALKTNLQYVMRSYKVLLFFIPGSISIIGVYISRTVVSVGRFRRGSLRMKPVSGGGMGGCGIILVRVKSLAGW